MPVLPAVLRQRLQPIPPPFPGKGASRPLPSAVPATSSAGTAHGERRTVRPRFKAEPFGCPAASLDAEPYRTSVLWAEEDDGATAGTVPDRCSNQLVAALNDVALGAVCQAHMHSRVGLQVIAAQHCGALARVHPCYRGRPWGGVAIYAHIARRHQHEPMPCKASDDRSHHRQRQHDSNQQLHQKPHTNGFSRGPPSRGGPG